MDTAKLFMNGQQQNVRLPVDFTLPGEEVCVKKVGNAILLYPRDTAWLNFLHSPVVSDDFGDAILTARREAAYPERESL